MQKKKIVVIGGGTGTAVVLSGLKAYPQFELTAVVVVSDDGGSTGRLRDEFGFLPVGDLRQCIAALASGKNEEIIRQLLLYRFGKKSSLRGHNLGNLILTALEDLADQKQKSPASAIEMASKIFRINGRVFPVSETATRLIIDYEGGMQIIGEKSLDDPKLGGKKIKQISFDQIAPIYQKASLAIEKADLIIIGPGDLYASLLANCLATGFDKAVEKNKQNGGKLLFVLNLMTHFSQTNQMSGRDHLEEVYRYVKRWPDYILVNNSTIKEKILKRYQKQNEFPVKNDLSNWSECQSKIIEHDLVTNIISQKEKNDQVERSLLRHDKEKLSQAILELIY